MPRYLKVVIVLLLANIFSYGQTYKHNTLWARLSFEKSIKKIDCKIDFDLRQQNNFHYLNKNPTKMPLMRWIRLNFESTKGKFTHSFLPAFIKSYPLVGKEIDFKNPPKNEIRLSFYEEYAKEFNKFSTNFRLGYELRNYLIKVHPKTTGRIRFRVLESYQMNKNTSFLLGTEPIINVFPNTPENIFNSNQLFVRIQQNITEKLKWDLGYNYIVRQRNTLVEHDLENAIISNFTIDL